MPINDRYRHMFCVSARSVLLVMCPLIVALPVTFGQTTPTSGVVPQANQTSSYAPHFTFDVASIREEKETGTHSVRVENPTRAASFIGEGVTVVSLISAAYGVDIHFVSNSPQWSWLTRYDVMAKSDPSVSSALSELSEIDARLEKQHMLQTLLTQRFNLTIHKEVRAASVYELTSDNGKPKLKEVTSKTMNSTDSGECHNSDGRCGKEHCGPEGCDLVALSYSMEYLCRNLQAQMGALVSDKTGLTGNYAFRIQFYGFGSTDEGNDSRYPSAFIAVQNQLGLKLVKKDEPVEYLIVDHIDRPGPN
jgi:uncharacterized protein (TIGR03435 family)